MCRYLATPVKAFFLLPSSNIVERFVSAAGYTFNDYRKNLLPMNLEVQLFLEVNRRFRNENLVDKVINEAR